LKATREIKTGVVAILVIILFIWGYNFLKDQNLYDTSRTMYAEYDNVQGLAPKSPITINGLKVGSVTEISFHPSKKGILVAHLQLDNPIEFSVNSVAQIYSPDFISGKSLKINLVMDQGSIAKDGDTLIGEVDSGIMGMINEQIAPLQVKVESFVVQTDSVMKSIDALMDKENQQNFKESLRNINGILSDFKTSSQYLESLMVENGKMDSIINNTNQTMNNLAAISDSIQAADLGATVASLESTLANFNSVLDSLKTGDGTMSKLLNDDELYVNLTNASKELEELLREVKEHPKRFVHLSVFGKKEKPYVEPEPE
jgi:phospholipid/cholesterol/gamma-HCH transport system substrate-binding protein